MAVLSSFLSTFRKTPTDVAGNPVVAGIPDEKKDPSTEAAIVNGSDEAPADVPGEDLQRGVQQVEAVTLSWSRRALIFVFVK